MRKIIAVIWRILTFPFRLIGNWLRNFLGGFKNLFTEEPEDSPLPDAFAKAVRQPTDILEHLNELRKHIFRGLAFFMLTTALSFVFINQLLDWLTEPIGGIDSLQAIEVTRKRCWDYDWVVEFDIKGLFDNIPHDLLLRAVERHTDIPWVRLYTQLMSVFRRSN